MWLAEREADLLPVGYFHVVFSVPAEKSPPIPDTWARGSASPPCSTPGDRR
jgi:hypothetical protein